MGEHKPDHDIEDAKLGASYSTFDLGEEAGDESEPNYDPFRDY